MQQLVDGALKKLIPCADRVLMQYPMTFYYFIFFLLAFALNNECVSSL